MSAVQGVSARWWRIGLGLLGTALLADAVMLIALRVFNTGVVIPVLMGTATLWLAWRWPTLQHWRASSRRRAWIWRIGWIGVVAWLLSVAGFFWLIQHAGHEDAATPAPRVIIVLGSGSPSCAPSPTLRSRLDEALKQARRWPEARIVVSGGVDSGLTCSEASVMADYLGRHGLARERLLLEERSTSTETNLKFSRIVLEQHGIPGTEPMLVITNDFHLPRAMRIAVKAGFSSVTGAAAPTPLYIRYNAWLREYCATLSSWLLGEF